MNYIDLFCGAGGFSLGFDSAGFQNIFSIEYEKEYAQSYRSNFPDHLLIEKDITRISNQEITNLCNNKKVNVIVGGPPCQGFSLAGNVGRKFLDDNRNHLFLEFGRFLDIIEPDFFVMENVAKLDTHLNGKTKQTILKYFEKLGYKVKAKIFNAYDFGVPQIRRRIIFIGTKLDVEIQFPSEKDYEKGKTVKDCIDFLPKLRSGENSLIPNHQAMNHSAQMLEKMSYVKDGGNRDSIPLPIRPMKGDARKYIRYNSKHPSVTVTGDMRKIFHYNQNRALTVRELALLQSFPINFNFLGTKISQQQQVGNAIPPRLALILAQTIKKMYA